MTALNFPPQPQEIGNTYVGTNDVTYVWNGTIWAVAGNPGSTGNVTFAGNTIATASGGNINISAGGYEWVFDENGNLTLPPGGTINFADGSNALTGGGGTADLGLFVFSSSTMGTQSPYSDIYITPNFDGHTQLYIPASENAVASPISISNLEGNIALYTGGSYAWTFNADGTTTFPNGTLLTPDNQSFLIKTTSGNVYTSVGSSGIDGAYIGSQDDLTGPNQAWSYIAADVSNINTPRVSFAIKPADTGAEVQWNFNALGGVTMPDSARLNSGGIGVTRSAEFGTVVDYSDPGVVNTSNIYMSAGTGEARIMVDANGAGLTYYGVENPGFAGFVAMDPGVTSQYAIGLDANSNIIIGATQPSGTLTTTLYTTGIGAITESLTINGLYADSTSTVVSGIANAMIQTGGGQVWQFGADGNLTLPVGGTINFSDGSNALVGGGGAVNTGNVTFSDINIIGTGNLHLQPDVATPGGYLDIFLTSGPDIHIAGNGETVILGRDDTANVSVGVDGTVTIQANAGTAYAWTFGIDGNITLPANGAINSISNSSGDGSGYSTMQLVPDNNRYTSDQYLIIDPTAPGHIHIRAGGTQDSSNASLIIGGEYSNFRVYQGNNPSVSVAANANEWNFGNDGTLALPNGAQIVSTAAEPVTAGQANVTYYQYDSNALDIAVSVGDQVQFPNFSGQILINEWGAGQLDMWLAGGGVAYLVGSSKTGDINYVDIGTLTGNGVINGYTWTSNVTVGAITFTAVRTRAGA